MRKIVTTQRFRVFSTTSTVHKPKQTFLSANISWPSEKTWRDNLDTSTQEKLVCKLLSRTINDVVRSPGKKDLRGVKDILKNTVESVNTQSVSIFTKQNENNLSLSSISLSRLNHLRGVLEVATGDTRRAGRLLQESSRLLEKTPYIDDYFLDRIGVLNDLAVNHALSGNLEAAKTFLQMCLSVSSKGSSQNDLLNTSLLINKSEIFLLEGKTEEAIKSLIEAELLNSCNIQVELAQTFSTESTTSLDIIGVDLCFHLYRGLVKAYLKSENLLRAGSYLQKIYDRYFNGKRVVSRVTLDDSPAMKLIKADYYTLLAFYNLKKKDESLNFVEVEEFLKNSVSFYREVNSPFTPTALENLRVWRTAETRVKSKSLLYENLETSENKKNKVVSLAYPTGFFLGGSFDLIIPKKAK